MTTLPASADEAWLKPWTDFVEAAEHHAGLAVPDDRSDLMESLHALFRARGSVAEGAALIRKALYP
jgi:hypothetical protein